MNRILSLKLGRYLCYLMVACMCCISTARIAFSQNPQPVIFMHGLSSSGGTWAATSVELESMLNIRSFRPGLPSYDPYVEQMYLLSAFLYHYSLPDTTILIGHSNGGLVSRGASLTHPVKGIITVGSPHNGAGLATTVRNGRLRHGISSVHSRINEIQHGMWLENYWGYWWLPIVAEPAFLAADILLWGLHGVVWYVEFSPQFAVLDDMIHNPRSEALETLNSPENLAREELMIPNRIGLKVVADGDFLGGPFRVFMDAHDAQLTYLDLAALGALMEFAGWEWFFSVDYGDFWFMEKSRAALSLVTLGWDAIYTPLWWCDFIGGYDGGWCSASDGVVPVTSQFYPGAQNRLVFGPAHTEETQSPIIRDKLYQILSEDFHVATR